jgi:hypothetical protein
MRTILFHASRKGRAALDDGLEIVHPAFNAKVMPADVVVDGDIIAIANITCSCHSPIEVVGAFESGFEAYLFEIGLVIIVVFLMEVVLVPLELFEQDEAPSFIKIDKFLDPI